MCRKQSKKIICKSQCLLIIKLNKEPGMLGYQTKVQIQCLIQQAALKGKLHKVVVQIITPLIIIIHLPKRKKSIIMLHLFKIIIQEM